MRALRTNPAVPVSRGKKKEKVSIAHGYRGAMGHFYPRRGVAIGVLAIYAAEADYRQLYAVNQAIGLVAGLVGAVVLALLDYRWLGRHLRLVYGAMIVMLVQPCSSQASVNGAQSWIGSAPSRCSLRSSQSRCRSWCSPVTWPRAVLLAT